jgi:predicted anti-sigma-YlaC factor YlaD
MTVCTQLSDRMPDVALRRSPWSPEEQRHLAACADCRAEWEVVTAAGRLGPAGRGVSDPAATAARVLRRLQTEPTRRAPARRAWAAGGLAAAAVLAVAVWPAHQTAAPSRMATPPATHIAVGDTAAAPGGPDFPLPELDSLPADVLDSVMRVLDEPLTRVGAWELPALADPGDQELARAFAGKEG